MVAASQASHEAQRPNYTGRRGAQWGGRPDPEPSAGAPSSRDRTGPLGRRAVGASWGRLSSCLVQPLLRLRWPPGRAVPCPWQDNGRAARLPAAGPQRSPPQRLGHAGLYPQGPATEAEPGRAAGTGSRSWAFVIRPLAPPSPNWPDLGRMHFPPRLRDGVSGGSGSRPVPQPANTQRPRGLPPARSSGWPPASISLEQPVWGPQGTWVPAGPAWCWREPPHPGSLRAIGITRRDVDVGPH